MPIYDLKSVFDTAQLLEQDYAKKMHFSKKEKNGLYLLRYIKDFLRPDNIAALGLLRSVIITKDKIVCFSPPKSLQCVDFTQKYGPTESVIENYIEGTMVNCYYYDNKWNFSTRGCIDGTNKFYHDSILSFRDMFLEALELSPISLSDLDTQYCYSFVLQHPANRIVVPFTHPYIILAAVFKCDGWKVEDKTAELGAQLLERKFPLPYQYQFESWNDVENNFASQATDYKIPGVMIKHADGARSKFRNPVYEKVRILKGNSPKLQYQYYVLYAKNAIAEYLKYYPENKDEFWEYRKELVSWTNQLFRLYHEFHVKRIISKDAVAYQFRPHVWTLHQYYLHELKPRGEYITKQYVIDYICTLEPARLMYAINYPSRKKNIESTTGVVTYAN
jgi:hypothetical protein